MKIVLTQTAFCLLKFLEYVVPCIVILLGIRFLLKPKQFVFRKLLHVVAFTCVMIMIMMSESWQGASFASVVIVIVIYPLLALVENRSWFADLFVQKSPGEIKRSLVMLFMMFAALTAVSWGLLGRKNECAASILMWGTGDAAAALVGIPFGKHKVISRLTDGKKSYEGSAAMFLVSFVFGFTFLYLYAGNPVIKALIASLLAAVCGTITELISASEVDTVTVPVVILFNLLIWR